MKTEGEERDYDRMEGGRREGRKEGRRGGWKERICTKEKKEGERSKQIL